MSKGDDRLGGDSLDEALRIAAITVKSSQFKDGGRLCDVGCGTGILVPHLCRQGLSADQILGVDLSPEMVRVAKRAHPGDLFF